MLSLLSFRSNRGGPHPIVKGSEYFKFVCRGSKTLLIVYSHVDVAQFRFSQHNTFKPLNFDQLYLNCRNNSYYLCGVPGLGQDKTATIAAIGNLISRNKYDRVVHFGNSMGAYGAFIYGLEIGGTIIGLAPEVLLGIQGGAGHLKMPNKHLAQDQLRSVTERLQTLSAYDDSVYLYFGQLDFADMVSGAFLKKFLDRQTRFVKMGPHSLAPFIEGNYGLVQFVLDILNNAGRDFSKGLVDAKFSDRVLIKVGYDTYNRIRFRVLDLDDLNRVENLDHYCHVFLQQRRRLGDEKLYENLPRRSVNILYHNCQLARNEGAWSTTLNVDDALQIARMYRRNDTWGQYHVFLEGLLRTRRVSERELTAVGVPEAVTSRITKKIATSGIR